MNKIAILTLAAGLAVTPVTATGCMSPDQIEEDRASAEKLRETQEELASLRGQLDRLEQYIKRDADQTANMLRARQELLAGIQRLEAYLRSQANE